jgi:hypothetical protein
MPKLKCITFDRCPKHPRHPRRRPVRPLDLDNPPSSLKDWKLVLRGGSMYLISPPGWTTQESRANMRNPNGPSVVHEIPRTDAFLHWITNDAADLDALFKNGGKYESQPLGWKPAPVEDDKPILSQIPPSDIGDA